MVVLGLPGDLLAVIATYTTEQATYRTLGLSEETIFLVYRSEYFWRAKVEVELKGLTIDPSIVAGRWAAYYRIANRTFYGRLAIVRGDRAIELPYIASVITRTPGSIIAYLPDTRELIVVPDHEPYNQVVRVKCPVPVKGMEVPSASGAVSLVDERGEVWDFGSSTAVLDARGLCDMVKAVAGVLLNRSGQLNVKELRPRIVDFNRVDAIDSSGRIHEIARGSKGLELGSTPLVTNYVDLDYNVHLTEGSVQGIFGRHAGVGVYYVIDPDRALVVYDSQGSALTRSAQIRSRPVQKCVTYRNKSPVLITDLE